MRLARERQWVASVWAPVVPLMIVGLAYGLATVLHGSGLIATFVAGMAYGTILAGSDDETARVAETLGSAMAAVTFFIFGAAILPITANELSWEPVLFGVLAVTVVRMLPVALALAGLRARLPTVAFLAWFGPRGLASIVFAVLILQGGPLPHLDLILTAISVTIVISVYAHGITALPLTNRYVAWAAAHSAARAAHDGGGMTSRVAAGLRGWYGDIRPEKGTIGKEALAGVPGAIGSVPDGMAAAVLAGVNPVFGLYASFVGPIAGGLTASTRLMVITTTSAAALAAGSALAGVDPAERPAALFLLTLLAGVLMVAAGILRLGRYTRFVSHSVMIGFLTGVAVNIVAGQIPDLAGAESEGRFAIAKAFNVLIHPSTIHLVSLLVGLAAIAILIVLGRTRLASFAAVIALAIPTLAVIVFGASEVTTVADVGEIPQGVPLPHFPELSAVSFPVLTGALAVAAIVLVQGSGVAESAPNRDGSRSNANRDFLAQGAGNVASGLFRGMPVGGSVGQTALNIAAGARSHWAAIFSGSVDAGHPRRVRRACRPRGDADPGSRPGGGRHRIAARR